MERLRSFDWSKTAPYITKECFESLDDAPDLHRWRAEWDNFSPNPTGVYLIAYPVIRLTPHAAHISLNSWYRLGQWETPDTPRTRLVYNNSGAAWAKPTQEDALDSLAIRLTRWAGFIDRDRRRALAAATVMETLRPRHRRNMGSVRAKLEKEAADD